MELGKYILNFINVNHDINPYHEIEQIVLNFLNPVIDYPKIVSVNKYYYHLITNLKIYQHLMETVRFKGNNAYGVNSANKHCLSACDLGYSKIVKLFYQLGNELQIQKIVISPLKLSKSIENGSFKTVKFLCELKPGLMYDVSFSAICMSKNLKIIKYCLLPVFHNEQINIHKSYEGSFRYICENGYLEIAKFLLTLEETHGKFNIHVLDDVILRKCCENNHFEMAKWLISLEGTHGKFNIHVLNDIIFRKCCENSYFEMAKWLISLEETHGKINIHSDNDSAFKSCCKNGNLEMLRWLYSLDHNFDIDLSGQFMIACVNNNLELAQFIYSINKNIYIRMKNDFIFHECCNKEYIEIAQWLCTICSKYRLSLQTDDMVYRSIRVKN